MKLRVLSAYDNNAQHLHYVAGDELEVAAAFGNWLLVDAPGSFERVQAKTLQEVVEDAKLSNTNDTPRPRRKPAARRK
jgi:hypothetical protein